MLGALWALWHLPEVISDPTVQRCCCNSLWILAQSVILAWLYNSTNAILPIVIICHAVINTADRFVLPELANKNSSDQADDAEDRAEKRADSERAEASNGARKIKAMRPRQCRCDRAAAEFRGFPAAAVDLRHVSPGWSRPSFC